MIAAALTFLVLAVLLLLCLIAGKGRWWWKLPLIVAVPVFMVAIWFAIESFSGYPVQQGLPAKSLFVYGYYVDPDPATHDPGAIYMWVILPKQNSLNPFAYASTTDPRAYKLPYNEQEAEQVQKATNLAKKGQQVEIKLKRKKAGVQGPTRHGDGGKNGGKFVAYKLPAARPPTKGQSG